MSQSIMEIVAAAKNAVPAISAEEAASLRGRPDVVFVDVRDAEEVAQTGRIAGALNVSRGMLEFRADETTPYHNPAFSRDRTIVLYCASGGRSALGGKALLDMGYKDVRNLGAFKDWAERGMPVEPA
jgi:rhodanese-related sulfurtransferase